MWGKFLIVALIVFIGYAVVGPSEFFYMILISFISVAVILYIWYRLEKGYNERKNKEKENYINVDEISPTTQKEHINAYNGILHYDKTGKVVVGISDITAKHIVVPNGVERIEEKAFMGCNRTQSIKLPSSLISIGNSAFEGCTHLLSIDIPNSVTNIGDRVFRGTSFMFITFHSLNPESIHVSDNCFEPSEYDMNTLVVPKESLEKYQQHSIFGKFKNLETYTE